LSKYILKLFITGQTPRARRAIDNINRICAERLGDAYEITIVDVLEEPEAAKQDRIIATPTLIKVVPPPLRRIIGDLSDSEKVLMGLDLPHAPALERTAEA
jgi:circadian clock protein KaiB